MKIGIDIRTVLQPADGKGVYTFNLVKNLLAIDRQNQYVLYTNGVNGNMAFFQSACIKIISGKKLSWHLNVIKDWKKERGDIFFAPTSFIIPALLSKKFHSIITIHDLIAFRSPLIHQAKAAILEHFFLPLALRKTKRVMVPSQHTKKDLMEIFHYPEEKIAVTPLAASEAFFKKKSGAELEEAGKKYRLPEKFILTVSGLQPRKNVSRLIAAFMMIAPKREDLSLVIVGGTGWKSEETKQKIAAAGPRVIHIERCAGADLPALYQAAQLFVFPSLYEGFGIPPLEAMESGVPVICSNRSSLPEVCGDAALYVNAESVEEMAEAMEKILTDKKVEKTLREKAGRQAETFSWKTTAQETLKAFTEGKINFN